MSFTLTFLGAVGTVTGSKYLLETAGKRFLIDCGLFQGYKQLRLRNWAPLPIEPRTIDAVILTHAHLDHSGYLPLLVRDGFRGSVYATSGTCDLAGVLLPDSGFLQERDAELANRFGSSKHKPAKPLYTLKDAKAALKRLHPVNFHEDVVLGEDIQIRFRPAGHILGAATVQFISGGRSMLFSGDLGQTGSATMVDPEIVRNTDYLIVESTYGNRLHDRSDPEVRLQKIINKVCKRGGTILIPSFAVGRAQSLLFHIQRLKSANQIPNIPVFLDSPMAINASKIFCKHLGEHRLTEDECYASCDVATYVQEAEDSKALDQNQVPKIIISASGMATGGRILPHLKSFASDRKNAIIFVGFQAGGTRGADITNGAKSVKIQGSDVSINAEVENLHMLSAHADADEILSWLRHFETPPKTTFITHGEPDASEALRRRIKADLEWECAVPEYRDSIVLD